jgi:thiamine-phosphate pyrophosphorylase
MINDHLALCKEMNVDDLYLGTDDFEFSEARKLLGVGKTIGVSCFKQLVLAS